LGDVVWVTDASGSTSQGRLASVAGDAVHVRVGGRVRSVAAADIRRMQWRKTDSPLTGVLVGAIIGAVPGIYWLVADPNECRGLCPEEYALIGAGAAIGGLIDHAIRKRVTVYSASGRSDWTAKIAALAAKGRSGLQVSVSF